MQNILKSFAVVLFVLLIATGTFAQGVSISNSYTVANQSSMLDISSSGNNKGILLPRVLESERTGNFNPLTQPAQGLMVYQTNIGTGGEGLYYNTSTNFVPFWVKAGATGWSTEGNSGTNPSTNFVGTIDANGMDFRTNNLIRMSLTSAGFVGISASSSNARLAVGGNGPMGGVYGTEVWVDNNLHVQGNETVAGGRGRLRLGTRSNYVGLYADQNSLSTNNDLILASTSGTVRIGPGGLPAFQKLLLPAGTGFQMTDGAAVDKILRSDASGNGTWEQLSSIMQVYSASAVRTLIPYSANPTFTDITGLSITVNITQASYIVIKTTGALESTNPTGGWSASIVALQKNGVSMQEQGTDLIALSPGYTQHHWEIYQTTEILTPGTYTFKVCSRKYYSSSNDFYAGGTTLPGLTNSGNLLVRVIPK